jgi:peptidase E
MNRTKPVYLLAGGRGGDAGTLTRLLAKALGEAERERPVVAHIGAANGDSTPFFLMMAGFLKKAGAGTVTPVKLARKQADVEAVRAALGSADAIFVSGGDVEAGMRWLNFHRLGPFLRMLQRRGRLFIGVSAGSIMLGTQWVRWLDPKDDSTAELFPCLGMAPLLCDTHAEDDDWEELRVAVALLGKNRTGYGIPNGAALCIRPGGTPAALGRPVVRFSRRAGRAVRTADLKPSPEKI